MSDEKCIERINEKSKEDNGNNQAHTSAFTRFRNSFWSFLAVYMIFSMTHGVQGSYTSSILTTLERKFNLPSIVAGSVVTVSTLGYFVSALIVSFFLPHRYRVKAFAWSMLGTGLCSIFYILPNFIFPTIRSDFKPSNTSTIDNSFSSNQKNHLLCYSDNRTFSEAHMYSLNHREESHEPNWIAVMFFSISEIFHGVAGAPIWTIGISMVDDHTPVALSSKLIGFMFFMRFLSPVISFGMGSIFLTFPDDLKETSLKPADPEWIGAWWLGFMVCFVINVSISIPTFFLASKFKKIGNHEKTEDICNSFEKEKETNDVVGVRSRVIDEEKALSVSNESENDKLTKMFTNATVEVVDGSDWANEGENIGDDSVLKKLNDNGGLNGEDELEVPIEKRSFKELLITVKRLFKNPTFTIITIGTCFDCFVLPFYSFIPKYVEVHFKQSAWKANLLGGMVPALAGAIMSYWGGFISGRFKPTIDHGVNNNVKFSLGMSLLNLLFMSSLIFIPCLDNYLPFGYDASNRSVSIRSTCNTDCACDVGQFDPVCGPHDQWYISPCQAGCKDVEYIDNHEVYSSCSCIEEVPFQAQGGYCGEECTYMTTLYIVCLVAFCFCLNIYNVAITNATLKTVSKRDKPVALALQTILICITLFPSPMVYGRFIDLTCILWKTSVSNDTTGSCLAYDHYAFRIALHGCLFVCRVMVVLLYSLTYFFSNRKLKELQRQAKKTPIITTVE